MITQQEQDFVDLAVKEGRVWVSPDLYETLIKLTEASQETADRLKGVVVMRAEWLPPMTAAALSTYPRSPFQPWEMIEHRQF
jgi:hypothetical protein